VKLTREVCMLSVVRSDVVKAKILRLRPRPQGQGRGLSQHERKVHRVDYHSHSWLPDAAHYIGSKRRWSYEEKVLLAREEVRDRTSVWLEHFSNSPRPGHSRPTPLCLCLG